MVTVRVICRGSAIARDYIGRVFGSNVRGVHLRSSAVGVGRVGKFVFYPLSRRSVALLIDSVSLAHCRTGSSVARVNESSLGASSVGRGDGSSSVRGGAPGSAVRTSSPRRHAGPGSLGHPGGSIQPVGPRRHRGRVRVRGRGRRLRERREAGPEEPLHRRGGWREV